MFIPDSGSRISYVDNFPPGSWIKGSENLLPSTQNYGIGIRNWKKTCRVSQIQIQGSKTHRISDPQHCYVVRKTGKKHHLHDVEEVVVDLGLVAELELDLVQVGERVLHLQPLEGGVSAPASTSAAWGRR
jgi:hypothetical protein